MLPRNVVASSVSHAGDGGFSTGMLVPETFLMFPET